MHMSILVKHLLVFIGLIRENIHFRIKILFDNFVN